MAKAAVLCITAAQAAGKGLALTKCTKVLIDLF